MVTTTTKADTPPAIHQAFAALAGLSGTGAAGTCTKPVPHRAQKWASSLFSFPHLVQNMVVMTVERQACIA
jgi:hypothetical protein